MELGSMIGTGATASVYALDERRVLKRFESYPSISSIEQEFANTRLAFDLGLPVPYIHEIIVHDGIPGMVMERIDGESALVRLIREPSLAADFGIRLAGLHFTIHQHRTDALRPIKPWMENRIRQGDDLLESEVETLVRLLHAQPDDSVLCHNDFHPDNILHTADRDVIIDWCDAAAGDRWADVARTMLILNGHALPNGVSQVTAERIMRMRAGVSEQYDSEYRRLSGVRELPVREWMVIVAASRLSFADPSEKSDNLERIRAFFDRTED